MSKPQRAAKLSAPRTRGFNRKKSALRLRERVRSSRRNQAGSESKFDLRPKQLFVESSGRVLPSVVGIFGQSGPVLAEFFGDYGVKLVAIISASGFSIVFV